MCVCGGGAGGGGMGGDGGGELPRVGGGKTPRYLASGETSCPDLVGGLGKINCYTG